ncbi:MAG: LysR family transcriptional regulator [Myxococcota bacterium]
MQWNDLSVLLEVSRCATMTEAAKRLGVDQTTVSRRLRALETSLGTQLVVRRRDGVDLTEAGVEASRSAEHMETISLDLERSLVGAESRLAGRLRVTTVEPIAVHHPDLFVDFGARFPDVALEVETHVGPRSLARREADVAIRWTRRPDEDLVAQKLVRAEFAIYVSKDLRASVGRRAPLSRYPWLSLGEEGDARPFHEFLHQIAPGAHIRCRFENLLSMQSALRAGGGAGFLPCAFGDDDPQLERLGPVRPGFGYDVWCLTHPDLRGTARVRAFVRHAVRYFEARTDAYAGRRSAPRPGHRG